MNARVQIDFDGFIRLGLSFIPFWSLLDNSLRFPTLEKAWIDIPVKKEFASLYHYWPNDDMKHGSATPYTNSGALPGDGLGLCFKPYVWLGWEEGGLGWCAESKRNMQLTDAQRTIEYIVGDGSVTLRIHLLDFMPQQWQGKVEIWPHALHPVDFMMGFQATPVKTIPLDADTGWRPFHTDYNKEGLLDIQQGKGEEDALDEIAGKGVKWLILHENWSAIQNYGLPADIGHLKRLVNACHRRGMKVMTYFGYEYSTLAPGWDDKAAQYLAQNTDGTYSGGWQRKPAQRDYVVCYNGGYSEEMLKRVEYAMDEFGIDGIYTDGTFIPCECANEKHGCGYLNEAGQLESVYPIFALREHVKKLYALVKARGGLLDAHQSSCCVMPVLAFCDSYFDGEHIQDKMKNDLSGNMRLDIFRAEYMGSNLGILPNFLLYDAPPDYTIEKISGLTLLHNVHTRINNKFANLDYVSKIWRLYDEFGTTGAKWHPYWRQDCPVKTRDAGVYASAFEYDGRYLAIAVNFGSGSLCSPVSLPAGCTRATDAMTRKEFVIDRGVAGIDLKSYEPTFVIFE